MRDTLLALLLLLLVTVGLAAEPSADVTPSSTTASSTLRMIGPGEPIEMGEDVNLLIEGLTLKEIEAAQDREDAEDIKLFDITAFPLRGVKIEAGYDWLFRTLKLEFESKYSGTYLVKMHFVRDGQLEIAAIEIEVKGDKPGPDPPKPDPPDPDPILPPLKNLQVILMLEHTDRRNPGGVQLFEHIDAVKVYLRTLQLQWTTSDNDQSNWETYLPDLKGATTPAIVIRDDRNQAAVAVLEFGVDEDATIDSLKKLGVK
jgi:hypothetical protein